MTVVADPYARLVAHLRQLPNACLALSGGVDSSLLLSAAKDALGNRLLALTFRSALQSRIDTDAAVRMARLLGVPHRVIDFDLLARPEIRSNPPDRCYGCKRTLFVRLQEIAASEGFQVILEGSHADDRPGERPGMRALVELGIRSPFIELGLGKAAIRDMARARGLSNWDQPPGACLATRIPFGQALTSERLARIERAEEAVRALGFDLVRVRDTGHRARIEVLPEALKSLAHPALLQRVREAVHRAGFEEAEIDPLGYGADRQNRPRGPDRG